MKKLIVLVSLNLLVTCWLYSQWYQGGTTLSWSGLSATGTTTAFNVLGLDKYTVAVTTTGSPSGCAMQIEGSLDNTNFFNLSGSQICTSNLMFHITEKPILYLRTNVTTLSGGTSPTVTVSLLGVRPGTRQ
jgi:hypothetical protein